jgi:hypothetical protein
MKIFGDETIEGGPVLRHVGLIGGARDGDVLGCHVLHTLRGIGLLLDAKSTSFDTGDIARRHEGSPRLFRWRRHSRLTNRSDDR